MDYRAAFQISAAGMAAEKLRLDVTALNLANMHVAGSSAEQVYRPQRVITQTVSFSQQFGRLAGNAAGVQTTVVPQNVAPRMVYEPGHPYANAKGMVAYPGVDNVTEMVTLNTALRAYEANVTAMNAARTMAARALEIGGQQ
ncbi:flagellar basal body rod protein FlgC [[Empedobacter] haloabium]|uniref:Flagellar basal-body rod protein FlgC n=1 Tax=[Empedobacter] haloabium TaxID=592317 RepID=A0ABZ1UIG8_9BURK